MTEQLDRLISRHRDKPSPTLSVEWALLRLLDGNGTNVLTQDLEDLCDPWEVFDATASLTDMLPDKPGLYMFVWRPLFRFSLAEVSPEAGPQKPDSVSQILYIGQAGDNSSHTLRNRYKSYRNYLTADPSSLWDSAGRFSRSELMRYLTLRPLEYWFTVIEDRSEIKGLEQRLLAMFNPPMNKIDIPKIKSQFKTPQKAFAKRTN
jgi:hypothetical protein